MPEGGGVDVAAAGGQRDEQSGRTRVTAGVLRGVLERGEPVRHEDAELGTGGGEGCIQRRCASDLDGVGVVERVVGHQHQVVLIVRRVPQRREYRGEVVGDLSQDGGEVRAGAVIGGGRLAYDRSLAPMSMVTSRVRGWLRR